MTNFNHGVEVTTVSDQAPAVRTVKTSVIGIVITAGKGPLLTPTLISGNRRQAIATFGAYSNNGDGFSGPEAFNGIFEQGGASVVAINVCDPATNRTVLAADPIVFNEVTDKAKAAHPYLIAATGVLATSAAAPINLSSGRQWTVPTGVTVTGVFLSEGGTAIPNAAGVAGYQIAAGVLTLGSNHAAVKTAWITYTVASFVENTDFSVDRETGIFSRLAAAPKLLRGSKLNVGYTYVDPTTVTEAQAIVGINLLASAASVVRVRPRILLAPRFTQAFDPLTHTSVANAVITALNTVAKMLGARVFSDACNTTKEDAVIHGQFFSGEGDRVCMHFPNHLVRLPDGTDGIQPASIRLAGLRAVVDNDEGFWTSESNHKIQGIIGLSVALSHGSDVLGTGGVETDTNYLNSHGISTTVWNDADTRGGNFRSWGNRQLNGEFLSVQRTADMVNESLAIAIAGAVDKNISRGLLAYVLEEGRDYLRSLEARGALMPNPSPNKIDDMWADPELNSPESVSLGELHIDYRINPPFPAERIVLRAHLTREYVTALFATAI